jgi:hypothetical protein
VSTTNVPSIISDKIAANFRQYAVTEILVKTNSAADIYGRLRRLYKDAFLSDSSVRRWVKQFKDGVTDIADSAALWSTQKRHD